MLPDRDPQLHHVLYEFGMGSIYWFGSRLKRLLLASSACCSTEMGVAIATLNFKILAHAAATSQHNLTVMVGFPVPGTPCK